MAFIPSCFVVSNATEAGIVYSPEDRPGDNPPNSFPGKLTAYLYRRYRYFGGARDKGLVSTTALTAAGVHLILFTTGRGTPFGAPVPTVKVSTNTALYVKKKNWIDFDAGQLLEGKSMEELSEEFFACIIDVASKNILTKNEQNNYREIAIFKKRGNPIARQPDNQKRQISKRHRATQENRPSVSSFLLFYCRIFSTYVE